MPKRPFVHIAASYTFGSERTFAALASDVRLPYSVNCASARTSARTRFILIVLKP